MNTIIDYNKLLNIKNKKLCYEINDNENNNTKIIYNYNVSHIDEFNNWLINKFDFDSEELLIILKEKYLKKNNTINKNEDKYQIISETGKIFLGQGIFDTKTLLCTSTTIINPNNSFQGITNLEILSEKDKISIKYIYIKAKAKNKEIINSYRDILWELEFEKSNNGYKILGLDNFIHINLYGYEDINLNIVFSPDNFNWENGETFELKFDRILYDNTIKINLEKNSYENEENYSIDIIDYLEEIKININNEEKMFGQIYEINYNILKIMSGMGGIAFSN